MLAEAQAHVKRRPLPRGVTCLIRKTLAGVWFEAACPQNAGGRCILGRRRWWAALRGFGWITAKERTIPQQCQLTGHPFDGSVGIRCEPKAKPVHATPGEHRRQGIDGDPCIDGAGMATRDTRLKFGAHVSREGLVELSLKRQEVFALDAELVQ